MRFWGGQTPPAWLREIASDRPRPLVIATDEPGVTPTAGDIVLKPWVDVQSYRQRFRVESWNTHDLLDGPFDDPHQALEAAFELGATSHLSVWLDYSDDSGSHDLDTVPIYVSESSKLKDP
jgi:hypothetical protein